MVNKTCYEKFENIKKFRKYFDIFAKKPLLKERIFTKIEEKFYFEFKIVKIANSGGETIYYGLVSTTQR
jgi:hypothetical protein